MKPKPTWQSVSGNSARKIPAAERAAITVACDRLLADVLIPHYLPEIRPSSDTNYPVHTEGRWHGSNYRFKLNRRRTLA